MFRQSVQRTALTSDAANSFFNDRIYGDAYGSDQSMLATLRALAYPRFKNDTDKIILRQGSFICDSDRLSMVAAKDEVQRVMSNFDMSLSDQFIVQGFRSSSKEHTAAYMRLIESEFCECFHGYERVEKITAFYKKSFDVICYINRSKRNSVIFIDGIDIRKLHYLQCAVLVAIPWYFDPEKGLNDDERSLINSFREQSPDMYLECISKLAERYDFRSTQIRTMLNGIEARFIKSQRDDLIEAIRDIDRKISDLTRQLGDRYRVREETCIRLLGVEEAINRGDKPESELAEYFVYNKHLFLDTVSDDTIYFKTIADLTQYDPDMAERMIENRNSILYMRNGSPRPVSYEDLSLLYRAIFLENRLTVQFCGSYYVELRGCRADAVSGQDYSSHEFANCIPNPHIDQYTCIGNNRGAIADMLAHHNYMGAVDQCIASCSNLNLGDVTVVNSFVKNMVKDIQDGGKKCVRLPDGSYVDFRDALAFVKGGAADGK